MPEIRGVIFDMDGVLIDAKDWHFEALNRALGLFGYQISRYDHLVTYDGLPTRDKLDMLSIESGLPRGLHGFINRQKQLYTEELVHARCKPLFHHEYCLTRLKAAGYRLAVASNAVKRSVDLMTEKAGLRRFFDAMVSNEDVARAKPDPEIYLKTMALLNLDPGSCLIVEDHPRGVEAGRAAGGHVVRVADVNEVTIDNILQAIELAEAGAL